MVCVVSFQCQIIFCSLYLFSKPTVAPQIRSLSLTEGFYFFIIFLTEGFLICVYLPLLRQSLFFSLLRLASSACRSLQCLISALTRGGESGLLFGLTCLVVLRRGTVQANTAVMCGECSQWLDQRGVAAVQGGLHFPDPSCSRSQGCCEGTVPGGLCISSAKLVSGCDTPGRYEPLRILGRLG